MNLEKIVTCDDPIIIEKFKYEIGNDRVSSFEIIDHSGEDNHPLYEVDIHGKVMEDYDMLINPYDNVIDIEDALLFEVLDGLIKYVVEPISQNLKSGALISKIKASYDSHEVAFFIAPNAYTMDANFPHGELCAGIDNNAPNNLKRFRELHQFNSDYRYLSDNIIKYYQYTADKLIINIKSILMVE